jgi:predicted RNA-binding Zn-ribbon protein involved in translation (DUF1610 family)
MATKMTLSYVCDRCGYEDTDKDSLYHYVVEVPTAKKPARMEMDLCVTCADELDTAYVDVWRPEVKGGLTAVNKTTGYAPSENPTVCEKCGFVAKSYNGLGVHKKRKGH